MTPSLLEVSSCSPSLGVREWTSKRGSHSPLADVKIAVEQVRRPPMSWNVIARSVSTFAQVAVSNVSSPRKMDIMTWVVRIASDAGPLMLPMRPLNAAV